jgi:hypothetical protein
MIRKRGGWFSEQTMPKHGGKHIDIRWELSQILPYRRAKQDPSAGHFGPDWFQGWANSSFTGGPRQIVNHLI